MGSAGNNHGFSSERISTHRTPEPLRLVSMCRANSTNDLDSLLVEATSDGAGSAAVLLASSSGEPRIRRAVGTTRRWDAPGVPTTVPGLPVSEKTPFDLASLTKPLVAAAILTELDAQGLEPSVAAAEFLPEFRTRDRQRITIAHLLTHTAGFPASWPDHAPDPRAARFRASAHPVDPAGAFHRYSCMSYIWLGLLAAQLAGSSLDNLVTRRILEPLGMFHTGYLPAEKDRDRAAATEYQAGRGMVQGIVHDETAFALGGVSGNAGIFGTAPDVLSFAEAIRTGAGLPPRVHSWLIEPFPVARQSGSTYRPTMGLRIADAWCSASPSPTVSHTGFTGTSFFAEPGGRWSFVLLTNRVHPSRGQAIVPALRAQIVAATVAE